MTAGTGAQRVQLLIGGRWQESRGGPADLIRTDPADRRRQVATVVQATAADVDLAFAAAAEAAPLWRASGAIARGRILLDAADLLRGRAERVASEIVQENGKTLTEARAEVEAAASFLEFFGGLGRGPWGDVLADRRPGARALTLVEPLGPVLLITPWNDPLLTPARKLGPALVAGNTVVLKPSEQTPIAARHLAEALLDAGLPDGVLNVINGAAGAMSDALLGHPSVRAVSFTGSERVGRLIMRVLADTDVRVQCELGGKNAVLVLDDADLDVATEVIVAAGFGQAGQRCTATSRVLAQRGILVELRDSLAERVAALRVGPGLDPSTEVGPIVSATQLDRLEAALAQAQREGAGVDGGGRPEDVELGYGNFLRPALVTGLARNAAMWSEELFGPIVALDAIDDLAAGIAAVNDVRHGLAAAIVTRDLSAALTFIDGVETGQVAVNLPTIGWDVHVPFGGFKASGSAFKEHGSVGLDFYTRRKSVAIR
jgi:alpha-ketoglutaric semialdehyde dehydrogenase